MNRRLAPILAAALGVAGCGGTAATPPTMTSAVASPAGTWSGAIIEPSSGDGTILLALVDQGSNSFSGTWSATFKSGDSFSGPAVAGLASSSGYFVILYVQPPPPCATGTGPGGSAPLSFTFVNMAVTSSQLTAVTERLACSGVSLQFGSVNLSKQ